MRSNFLRSGRVLALSMACALICGAALAEKPQWAGNGNKHEQKEKSQRPKSPKAPEVKVGAYFLDQQRVAERDYYARQDTAIYEWPMTSC